jgi:hypothetical protein
MVKRGGTRHRDLRGPGAHVDRRRGLCQHGHRPGRPARLPDRDGRDVDGAAAGQDTDGAVGGDRPALAGDADQAVDRCGGHRDAARRRVTSPSPTASYSTSSPPADYATPGSQSWTRPSGYGGQRPLSGGMAWRVAACQWTSRRSPTRHWPFGVCFMGRPNMMFSKARGDPLDGQHRAPFVCRVRCAGNTAAHVLDRVLALGNLGRVIENLPDRLRGEVTARAVRRAARGERLAAKLRYRKRGKAIGGNGPVQAERTPSSADESVHAGTVWRAVRCRLAHRLPRHVAGDRGLLGHGHRTAPPPSSSCHRMSYADRRSSAHRSAQPNRPGSRPPSAPSCAGRSHRSRGQAKHPTAHDRGW